MAIINFGFGRPQRQQVWNARSMIVYGRPSQGILPVAPSTMNLTDTIDNMHNPVNAVMEGHQLPNKRAVGLSGLPGQFAKIFNE